jgi:hypothetical protein
VSVKSDWSWTDPYIPLVKEIVGKHLLEVTPIAVDRHEAADLRLLQARNLSIGCRIRRGTFQASYANQFTVRRKRLSGRLTEFEKIAQGYCDVMFYGFAADGDMPALPAWNLIDLAAFRYHLIMSPNVIRGGECSTADGTMFRFYDLRSFPKEPPVLIASSHGRAKLLSIL